MGEPRVVRADADRRFETTVDGVTAFLAFRRNGRLIVLTHTDVPDAIGGRGIAGALARAAFAYAIENDLTIVPVCPYVRSYLDDHPDEAQRLKIADVLR